MAKNKTIIFCLLILMLIPAVSYGEEGDEPYEDAPGFEELIEGYEKTPIEITSFDRKNGLLTGYSSPGAQITIDTGESMTVDSSGEFQFKIPKEIKMVIINGVDTDGMFPNSVNYHLDQQRVMSEEEDTIPPDISPVENSEKKEVKEVKETIKKEEVKPDKNESASKERQEKTKKSSSSKKEITKKNSTSNKDKKKISSGESKRKKVTSDKKKQKPKKNKKVYLLIGLLLIVVGISFSILYIQKKKKEKSRKSKKKKKIKHKKTKYKKTVTKKK